MNQAISEEPAMSNQQTEPRNGTLDVYQHARADVTRLDQLYQQVSRDLLERLREAAAELEASNRERDALRQEVEQLRATVAEQATDLKLYNRSVLALTHR